MKRELIMYTDSKSPVSEIFRTLRTNILFMDTNENSKVILLTSTLPGEGKSWISANLAVTFAQTGKKIILIDSDMRKGRQYSILDLSPTPGLSNYLTGVDINESIRKEKKLSHYIQKTEIENLDVMTAGNVPPNPSELLSSNKMINLLQQVKKLYDIVIIDGTPCQLVADSLILSRIVDSTILVASHKYTKKKDLERVITSINNVGGKIFGVVLNKVPIPTKKYEQSYYYGATNENKKDEDRFTNESKEDIENKAKLERKAEKEKPKDKKEEQKGNKKENIDKKAEIKKGNEKENRNKKIEPKKGNEKESNKKDVKNNVQKTNTELKEKVRATNNIKKVGKQEEVTSKNKKKVDINAADFTKIEKVEKVEVIEGKKRKKDKYVVKKEIVVPLFEQIMSKT